MDKLHNSMLTVFPIIIKHWPALEIMPADVDSPNARVSMQSTVLRLWNGIQQHSCDYLVRWKTDTYLHHESDCVGAVDFSSECSGSRASNSL